MNQDVNGNTSALDVEPLLPDGWKPGDDIFAGVEEVKGDTPFDDGLMVGDDLSALLADEEENAGASEAPTTGTEQAAQEPNAGAQTDAAADGQGQTMAPRILQLKVNHQQREVDVNQMSNDELIAALQKSAAFDALKEAENKRKYREAYNSQLEAGMSEEVAKIVAMHAADGKSYSVSDDEETDESNTAEDLAAVSGEDRDFKREVAMLRALYPDFNVMPQAVMDAYNRGAPLYAAYGAYLNEQKLKAESKENSDLRRQNQILRQNAASAAKAPVTGVSGGGSVTPEKEDPFIKGFDADPW